MSARTQLRGSARENCAGKGAPGREGGREGGFLKVFLTRHTYVVSKGEATIEALVDRLEGEKMRGSKGVDRVG